MNVSRRISAVALAGALLLVACGGDDDSAGSDTPPATTADAGAGGSTTTVAAGSTATTEPGDSGGGDSGDPVPTIAPDLPEPFLAGVGPVAIIGEPLPPYPTDDDEDDPAVGLPAPVIIGETVAGEPIRIDATVDGPTWMVFLAHWCSHCNAEIPVINELRDAGRIPDDINVVGVSTAFNPDRPNWPPDAWLNDKDWTFTAINDGIDTVAETYILAASFGIGGFPFSMLVDGDGLVVERWSGERGADELEALLTDNFAGG